MNSCSLGPLGRLIFCGIIRRLRGTASAPLVVTSIRAERSRRDRALQDFGRKTYLTDWQMQTILIACEFAEPQTPIKPPQGWLVRVRRDATLWAYFLGLRRVAWMRQNDN